MLTLADSLISTTSRDVRLRMRPDLEARRHKYHGQSYWVIKEPVGLNYYRFHEEEYAILQMLDGHTSMEQIKERFEDEFTPQKITFQDLQQFIGMLHRSGLVISESAGQGKQLKKRRDEKRWKEFWGKLANIFALRFRGIDPERLLNWLHKYTWFVFTPPFMALWLMVALSAGTLVLVEFDSFRSRLPAFHDFFAPHNWVYLAIVMAVVKIMHEFGHGLSCKHYGGECHELGAMLLVFTPALYCNVSDSWMLPNKWHRAFMGGAAGMYVEIFLASIATFVWWFSEPGPVNQVALCVMFICSVSTVMFNGNPLLRFDGYYILMDLLEIPNLRQKSTEVLRRFLFKWCLGDEQPENPFLPQKHRFLFGLFTIAAVIYRWMVVFSILLFLNAVLKPYGLQVIGRLIALTGFIGLVVQPVVELVRFFYTPGRMNKVKRHRIAISAAVAVGAVAFVLFLPLPHYVRCSFEIAPRDAAAIYAVAPGRMSANVKPGDTVTANETVLVEMESLPLKGELEKLRGELKQAETELMALEEQGFTNPSVLLQIPPAEEMVRSLKEQVAEKEVQYRRLKIRSPISGIVMPAAYKPGSGEDGRLPTWSGNVFDDRNASAVLNEGDQICYVGNPVQLEAVLVIDQGDFNLVQEGNPVGLKLESYRGKNAYFTTIAEKASVELKITPTALSQQAGGGVQSKPDKSGNARPMNTSYQAKAIVDNPDGTISLGMRGKARIFVGYTPLSMRAYRFVAKTFNFDL